MIPIEAVYATVEVKARLTKEELASTFASIERIRRLGERKVYAQHVAVEAKGKKKGLIVATVELPLDLAPRAFVFAYDSVWETIDGFVEATRSALDGAGAHLHGALVLSKGWFLYQVAYQDRPVVKAFADNALMRFTRNMITLVSSMEMRPASMHRYLGTEEKELVSENASAGPGVTAARLTDASFPKTAAKTSPGRSAGSRRGRRRVAPRSRGSA
jgi:hypothetical protein